MSNIYDCYLTVGELKKKLKNIPDETRVVYERIEDIYFNDNDWDTINFENCDIDYSKLTKDETFEEMDYNAVLAFSCEDRISRDGKQYLFITAHY